MTEDNKRQNIADEVVRARGRLSDARLLRSAGRLDTAVSQAYYCAYHFAKALLLMDGLQTKTHSGLIHMVNVHFVRTGRLAPEAVRVLTNLEGQRLMADYDAASVFTERMADEALLAAEQLGEEVEERLKTAGYL